MCGFRLCSFTFKSLLRPVDCMLCTCLLVDGLALLSLIANWPVRLGIAFTSPGSFTLTKEKLCKKATGSLHGFLSNINVYNGTSFKTIVNFLILLLNPTETPPRFFQLLYRHRWKLKSVSKSVKLPSLREIG